MISAILVATTLIICQSLPPQTPIIGIYTQDAPNFYNLTRTYIAASYVKFIQMSGAQVVPIFYNQSQSSLKQLLGQINGVLFPGGGMEFNLKNTFTTNADIILKYAISENDKGNVFPVWGTCLGHQLLSFLTSGYDSNVLKQVNGEVHVVNNINILNNSSVILKNWSPNHFRAATQKPGVLYYNHNWAVYTSYFNKNQKLNSFWNLIATTTSSYGQEFVTIQQAKQYPFYSVQFHPQKSPFEWKLDANRTRQSIEIVQLVSNNFVEKARLSNNRFKDQNSLMNSLIYNYDTVSPNDVYDLQSFQQLYVFEQNHLRNKMNKRGPRGPMLKKIILE